MTDQDHDDLAAELERVREVLADALAVIGRRGGVRSPLAAVAEVRELLAGEVPADDLAAALARRENSQRARRDAVLGVHHGYGDGPDGWGDRPVTDRSEARARLHARFRDEAAGPPNGTEVACRCSAHGTFLLWVSPPAPAGPVACGPECAVR